LSLKKYAERQADRQVRHELLLSLDSLPGQNEGNTVETGAMTSLKDYVSRIQKGLKEIFLRPSSSRDWENLFFSCMFRQQHSCCVT